MCTHAFDGFQKQMFGVLGKQLKNDAFLSIKQELITE